jgi:hypothetical protein
MKEKLPPNVRRGLLRVYLAIVAPWAAWFGYQAFDVYPYGPVWRNVFLALSLPIGGPVLFFAINWVVTGIRKSAPDANAVQPPQEARSQSSHFEIKRERSSIRETNASSRQTTVSTEVEALFKKLKHLMDNEKAQIDALPESLRLEVLSGADCDEISGATGEFGRDPRNPVPVNGPLGEMIYLSNLRTTASQQILFHRLGSIGNVDAYETVSFDGAVWDIFFFDLYHPRMSRLAPFGYRIAAGAERERVLLGTDEFVASFPDQLPDAISNTSGRLLGGRMRPRQVREAIDRINFRRPSDHQIRLNSVMVMLRTKAVPKPVTGRKAEAAPEPATEIEAETGPEVAAELEAKPAPEPATEFEAEAAPKPAIEREARATPEPVTEIEADTGPRLATEREAKATPEPVTEIEAETGPKLAAELEAKVAPELVTEIEVETAAPKPLTEFCSRITEHQLQNEVDKIDNEDLSKSGTILFMLIALAAGNFWNQALKHDKLNSSFAVTNSDVVIVEALYWVWCLIGEMTFTDFDATLAVGEADERRAKIADNERDKLFALRKALELMDTQIREKTGWDVDNVKAARLKEYCDIQDTGRLISAFKRRVLLSIGKQSINDKDTDDLGRFGLEDTTLTEVITIWLRQLPARIFDLLV